MKFKIEHFIENGLAEAPPFEVDVESVDELVDLLIDEMLDDAGQPYGKLILERVE